jgi:uncharacterized protein YgiM (DUF1202 family)
MSPTPPASSRHAGAWGHRLSAAVPALLLVLPLVLWAATAQAQNAPATASLAPAPTPTAPAEPEPADDRRQVDDPYLSLHTGPGRGYPVFHVVHRGEWVRLLQRFTDWFQVQSADGRLGWVPRTELEKTLSASGQRRSFRDVLLEDYLQRRLQAGAAWGRFKGEPQIHFWAGYRLSDTLSAEAAWTQVQGVYAGSTLWQLSLQIEPWSQQRLSPYFSTGLGQFHNLPNTSLVENQATTARLGQASLGLNYHLTDRFLLRAEASRVQAFLSDTRSDSYSSARLGLGFFF